MHEDDYFIQDKMEGPLAYQARSDTDTIYFDKSMKEPYCKYFLNISIKEVNSHFERNHWKLLLHSDVSKRQPILYTVWSMKRNIDIVTRQLHNWKAILNVHWGQQDYGLKYSET